MLNIKNYVNNWRKQKTKSADFITTTKPMDVTNNGYNSGLKQNQTDASDTSCDDNNFKLIHNKRTSVS